MGARISPIAPSPAKRAPPASTMIASAIAYMGSRVNDHISQNIASAVRNAATAPEIVIAQVAGIPSTRAGKAIVYGPANCIENKDYGCGSLGESSRPV